ncbi:hypothetical protein [Vibrio astriarenae]|uniref:hypothetical protein n=1 Tax=Vibrio astriarenae TaxID=1481923 RepID=UPI0019539432|nr:hypothetical protein [Vibrio astriarenae]
MDDLDDKMREAYEAGRQNGQALNLLSNWCEHAEFCRSGGIGMLEAETGLPIGHMGMQCKYSKQSTTYSWLLQDSIYSFYKSSCIDCKERVPVGVPNILEFIVPRMQEEEKRKLQAIQHAELKKKAQNERRLKRLELRPTLSFEETFVLDLLDELDVDGIASDDPRLEKFAHLAPEVFTPRIVDLLLQAVVGDDYLPYSTHAANALLNACIDEAKKLPVALFLIQRSSISPSTINVVLSNVDTLRVNQLEIALRGFALLATKSAPDPFIFSDQLRQVDSDPLKRLFDARKTDLTEALSRLFSRKESISIQTATRALIGINDSSLLTHFLRDIVALLMRRRLLLPEEGSDSNVIHFLRKAASLCLLQIPESTDKVIQSYLTDNDPVGFDESNRIYDSAIRLVKSDTRIEDVHKVAFKRLLWAAIESPDNHRNRALDTFRYTKSELSTLALDSFDDLIGAAATLSEKYEHVGKEGALEVPYSFSDRIEQSNKKREISSLQSSLVNLAALGAKCRGQKGIEDFLSLYRKLPKNQEQMRGCMITHITKMVTGVSSLNLVLSDWYGALMDESVLVRASAIDAWEYVPFDVIKYFPNLFFDAYSLALSDPYTMVHKRAVWTLMHRAFPEGKRKLLKDRLRNLVIVYSNENDEEFLIDCINLLVSLCLTEAEIEGAYGQMLSAILLKQEGRALYYAVSTPSFGLKKLPNFLKVILKAVQDSYVRGISIRECKETILVSSKQELSNSTEELVCALEQLKPLHPKDFIEAITYAAAFSVSGDSAIGAKLFNDLLKGIPEEPRNQLWRIQTDLVATALQIESEIKVGNLSSESTQKWQSLVHDLEKEYEERAKFRNVPPGFNF